MQGLSKLFVWAAYILLAVIAKIAVDSRTVKLTKRDIVIKTVLSLFAGIMAAVICENFGYKQLGKIVVPAATLIGEGVIVYIMTNWRWILNKIFTGWFPKKDKNQ